MLDSAKAWYNALNINNQISPVLEPDWSNSVLIKNQNGVKIIGAVLFKNDYTYVEINFFCANRKEFGLIKEYNWYSNKLSIFEFNNNHTNKIIYPICQLKHTASNKKALAIENQYLGEVVVNATTRSTGGNLFKQYIYPITDWSGVGGGGSEGGGGGGGYSYPFRLVSPNLDVSALNKYPKFKNLASNLQNFLKKYSNVLKALVEYTGFSEAEILELMKPGKGPKVITKPNLVYKGNECFGQFDPITKSIIINEN